MTRGCLPAFASNSSTWPVLPMLEKVPWGEFSFFFSNVNSSLAALHILRRLQRVPARLLQRKRRRLLHWLPSLVTEPPTLATAKRCLNRSASRSHELPAPTAMEWAMEEAWNRSLSRQRGGFIQDPNFKVPNLMWLLAEDGATEHSHVRACDRNFVVLKVKRLLLNMEKERSKMASILRGAAHRPPSRAPSQA
eukprot:symbB.v1.2.023983.t3/scaffold2238.1/size84887/1